MKQKSQAWVGAALSLFACARADDLDTARDEPPSLDGSAGATAGPVPLADAEARPVGRGDAEVRDGEARDADVRRDAEAQDASRDADAAEAAGPDATPDAAPVGCGPANCRGCCDARGRCEGGTSDYTCGSGGEACVDCRAIARICSIRGVCY